MSGHADDPEREPASTSGGFGAELIERLAGREKSFGRYRLEGELARGGQGAILRVWDEDLRRNLAMKVTLAEGESASASDADPKTLGRFLEEAQVTGQLDHPGIVPVHELGLDHRGGLYFTMRLVKGMDLHRVFQMVAKGEDGWNRTRVLGVLLKVCEAMSYAHSKHVIHRDLKPANVMVGRFGEAYVMDWGLARVQGTRDEKDIRVRPASQVSLSRVESDRRKDAGTSDDSPLVTMDGDVLGTPAYMSPEQARGDLEVMGPASDVYSMGAILYELLAGHPPYVPRDARLNAYAIWGLLQNGPPTPVSQLATDAPVELVAICEKAMAREPRDRYPDMAELAEDLRAFLERRVVSAYETGAVAELKKWVARNKPLAAASAAAVLALVAGLAASSTLYVEARASAKEASQAAERERLAAAAAEHQRQLAAARADELEQVSSFQAKQLMAISTERMGTELREALLRELPEEDRAEMREELSGINFTTIAAAALENNIFRPTISAIDQRFGDQPLVQARLLSSAALALNELGRSVAVVEPHRRALEIRRRELGPEDQETLFSMVVLGRALEQRGELEEAQPLLAEAVETSRRVFGEDHPATLAALQAWGAFLFDSRRLEEAAPVIRQLAEAADRGVASAELLDATTLLMIGTHYRISGQLDEAEGFLRSALERSRARTGPRDVLTLMIANNLGELLLQLGEVEEARELGAEARAGFEQLFGEEHMLTLTSYGNRGLRFMQLGQYDEARADFQRAYDGFRSTLGDQNRATLMNEGNLGAAFFRLGELEEAEVHMRAAFEGFRNLLGERAEPTVTNETHLSAVLCDRGQYEEALQLASDAASDGEGVPGWSRDHWRTAEARSLRGEALVRLERYDEAEPILLEAYETLERRIPRPRRKPTLSRTATALVSLYGATDRPDEVAKWQAIVEEL